MNTFIIVETIFGKEYKIATKSHRFVGPTMYMLLADTYFIHLQTTEMIHMEGVGSIENIRHVQSTARRNKYTTYEDAVHSIEELEAEQEENKEKEKECDNDNRSTDKKAL